MQEGILEWLKAADVSEVRDLAKWPLVFTLRSHGVEVSPMTGH